MCVCVCVVNDLLPLMKRQGWKNAAYRSDMDYICRIQGLGKPRVLLGPHQVPFLKQKPDVPFLMAEVVKVAVGSTSESSAWDMTGPAAAARPCDGSNMLFYTFLVSLSCLAVN